MRDIDCGPPTEPNPLQPVDTLEYQCACVVRLSDFDPNRLARLLKKWVLAMTAGVAFETDEANNEE